MGSISPGLAHVFYYRGLQVSNPIVGSVMTLLGPVTSLTSSVVLLHEQFNLLQLASIVGLLTTVSFLSRANLTSAASA